MECTNDIHITGSGYQIGGIVAMNDKGEIKDCDNYGRIQGQERVGGIVGRNTGSVLNCMTAKEANTQGECKVGGIAGNNTVGATISNCCNLGTVNSTGKQGDHASTGGIVGYNEGTVQKCIKEPRKELSPYAPKINTADIITFENILLKYKITPSDGIIKTNPKTKSPTP